MRLVFTSLCVLALSACAHNSTPVQNAESLPYIMDFERSGADIVPVRTTHRAILWSHQDTLYKNIAVDSVTGFPKLRVFSNQPSRGRFEKALANALVKSDLTDARNKLPGYHLEVTYNPSEKITVVNTEPERFDPLPEAEETTENDAETDVVEKAKPKTHKTKIKTDPTTTYSLVNVRTKKIVYEKTIGYSKAKGISQKQHIEDNITLFLKDLAGAQKVPLTYLVACNQYEPTPHLMTLIALDEVRIRTDNCRDYKKHGHDRPGSAFATWN